MAKKITALFFFSLDCSNFGVNKLSSMKVFNFIRFIFCCLLLGGFFQVGVAQCDLRTNGKETLRLEMLSEGGTNGAGITWNPERKIYYCAMAGNMSYPIEVFNSQGSSIYNDAAGFDFRGFWYNPKTKSVEGNGYKNFGIWQSNMNSKGFPAGEGITILEITNQPDDNSCGAFEPKKQLVYFLEPGLSIFSITRSGKMSKKKIQLKDCPADEGSINYTTLIYTACKGKEFGILDYEEFKIYFFSKKGKFAGEVSLPDNATPESAFGFSYANEMVFIFDKENRVWTGYKICQ